MKVPETELSTCGPCDRLNIPRLKCVRCRTKAKQAHTKIEFPVIESKFDLSRLEVENLLTGFLSGALGAQPIVQLTNLNMLPKACRAQVQIPEASGSVWIAWSTASGPMVVWGKVDLQGSRQINACLMFLEWWDTPKGYHALWAHCDPKRPSEWTIGRGWLKESR